MSVERVDGLTGGAARVPQHGPAGVGGPDFADVLRSRIDGVRFSGHAVQRMERRSIDFDAGIAARLDAAVTKAAAKGVRESLVLVDDTAFVVSVRNRTVVTAVDREHMKEHVFTNIDGAVIG